MAFALLFIIHTVWENDSYPSTGNRCAGQKVKSRNRRNQQRFSE